MKLNVVSIPLRLRVGVMTLFLSCPLIAFEVILATRSPWWQLPYKKMGYWALAYGLVSILLSIWVFYAKRWVISITTLLVGVWICSSFWYALRINDSTLGFYSIFLLALYSFIISWLRHEMKRSFYDPHLAWYQGKPKPIPGLKCKLYSGDQIFEYNVSRMDKDGAFLFLNQSHPNYPISSSQVQQSKDLNLLFQFKGDQIKCAGILILLLEKGLGLGIQFKYKNLDQKKDVGDFVETLIEGGYVF